MKRVVVIGAGVGGLSTAAVLARRGLNVTVLEAQVVPGGCASTFYHQGYRFDAGATLAGGFYPGGPMDLLACQAGIDSWPSHPASPAMVVHLPDGAEVRRYAGEQRQAEHRAAFGKEGLAFWSWQEETADAMWALSLRLPSWPPGSLAELAQLLSSGTGWLKTNLKGRSPFSLAADAFRTVSSHLEGMPERLQHFVDAQLLISAQTTSRYANALYGAAALDLPRRGVVHLRGGMGSIAQRLVKSIEQNGGKVLFRQQATSLRMKNGLPASVETRSDSFPADLVIANLTPWDLRNILGETAPARLKKLPPVNEQGWGAFVLYLGIDESVLPPDFPLHHQLLQGQTLAEGNSLFLSFSPGWDSGRAPQGQRAVTLSTHTRLERWWELYQNDRPANEKLKEEYTARIIEAAERILPGIREAVNLSIPGTPVTFARFTRRSMGWVGGFPQTGLFRAFGPHQADNIWMVGDSIFPGQSVAAVALGGLRTAHSVLRELHIVEEHASETRLQKLCLPEQADEA